MKRLTDDDFRAEAFGRGDRTQKEMLADHDLAREYVKRLAAELRATAFYRNNHGDGALCWCGPKYEACYVGVGTRDPDCERKSRLLSEVGE